MYGSDWMKVLRFGELLGGAMQQADVRVGALDHLAVELEHEAQHAVRRRVLRAEVQRVVLDLGHQDSRRAAMGQGAPSGPLEACAPSGGSERM